MYMVTGKKMFGYSIQRIFVSLSIPSFSNAHTLTRKHALKIFIMIITEVEYDIYYQVKNKDLFFEKITVSVII